MRWRGGAGVIAAAGIMTMAGMVVVVAGCGSTTVGGTPVGGASSTSLGGKTTPGTGTVLGTFQRAGGPALPNGGTLVVPLAGVISFQRAGGGTTSVTVGKTGKFSVLLPPGTYRVSGRSASIQQQNPDGSTSTPPCSMPLTARVRAGETERITVVCAVP